MLNVEEIKKVICDTSYITLRELHGKSHTKHIAGTRHLCAYFIKKHTILSLTSIGKTLGNRDHTSIINSISRVRKLTLSDINFKYLYIHISNTLNILSKNNIEKLYIEFDKHQSVHEIAVADFIINNPQYDITVNSPSQKDLLLACQKLSVRRKSIPAPIMQHIQAICYNALLN